MVLLYQRSTKFFHIYIDQYVQFLTKDSLGFLGVFCGSLGVLGVPWGLLGFLDDPWNFFGFLEAPYIPRDS